MLVVVDGVVAHDKGGTLAIAENREQFDPCVVSCTRRLLHRHRRKLVLVRCAVPDLHLINAEYLLHSPSAKPGRWYNCVVESLVYNFRKSNFPLSLRSCLLVVPQMKEKKEDW